MQECLKKKQSTYKKKASDTGQCSDMILL